MGFMKRPKAPEPTAQELAGVARQSRMIDEETDEIEKRLKAQARGKLGSKSLMAPAIKASKKSGGVSRRGMMGGGSSGAGGGGSGMSGGGTYGGSNFNKK